MTNINYSKKTVTIDGVTVALEYAVLVAFELMGNVIVLFDPDELIPKSGRFHNLIALDMNGSKLWEAELPTTSTGDCYIEISSKKPLQAISFKSYVSEIDIGTGMIISKNFTK
jgi:hypothetical protein